jgi:hypothetical protein
VDDYLVVRAAFWAGEAAKLGIGVVLILAGTAKFAFNREFRTSLSDIVQWRFAIAVVAFAIPALEIALGTVALLRPSALVWILSAALFTVFTIALAMQLASGAPQTCGCFGKRQAVTRSAVIRNIGLTCLAVALSVQAPVLTLTAVLVGSSLLAAPLYLQR